MAFSAFPQKGKFKKKNKTTFNNPTLYCPFITCYFKDKLSGVVAVTLLLSCLVSSRLDLL